MPVDVMDTAMAVRVPTKPTKASKVRRLEGKKRRSNIKGMRQTKPGAHD